MKIGYKQNKLLCFLFLIKLFFLFLAEFVYSRLSQLGDSHRYLEAYVPFSYRALINSTDFMFWTGGIVQFLQKPLYHLPAMLISFSGVVISFNYFKSIGVFKNKWLLFVFLAANLMPSYLLWTSIHSKEAIASTIMTFIVISLIKYERNEHDQVGFFFLVLISYFCLIFKPQYFAAIMSCLVFLFLYKNLKLKGSGLVCLFLLMIGTQAALLYSVRDLIDLISLNMYQHFDPENAQSTRENTYFVKEGDFFRGIFGNMFLAFWGPSVNEVLHRPMWAVFFVESAFIILLIVFLLLGCFKRVLIYKISPLVMGLLCFVLFWLLFVHYPFGIFNPGSAIRYRQSFYPFIVIILIYFYHRADFTSSLKRGNQ